MRFLPAPCAIRYEAPKRIDEEPDKLYTQSGNGYGLCGSGPDKVLPATTSNYFHEKEGPDGLTQGFPNEFAKDNNNVGHFESLRVPFRNVHNRFRTRVFDHGKHRYYASSEGYINGYSRGISYEYNNVRDGFPKNNLRKQKKQEELVP
ncbi:uncharacterized protein A4U43_UnF7530 [Asparagus officinalis]|uniref:Uncharacterized protein n=1 Tax=Asparagus officinalis TaxID=4686 RepID=A0A1R3L676_ASPOF|nr:uncharacterized protein A4U43_UnF7530 [Asparagus officinalis]